MTGIGLHLSGFLPSLGSAAWLLTGLGSSGAVLGSVIALRTWHGQRWSRSVRDQPGQAPSRDRDGSPASDEIQTLTRAFRQMLGALDTAHSEALRRSQLAFLGEIAGNIAHEVRTPLSTLKAAAQLVGNPGVAPDRQQRLLESIVSEVDRLNRVVTDLVDIARPATASYRPEPVGPVVARAVSLFAAAADTASVQLQYDAAPEPLVVRGSSDRLYQTLVNLIRNAMQAVGESGTVTVRSRRHGDTVVLEIEDSGPGVPPDMLPKIFSPFVTMKPDGAGLGLAIARRIVEEHGGTISVENREDVGARFTIRLPLTDDTA